MHGIKVKRLTENEEYEPLSQQVYAELIKEIDRLFDTLKSDLSTVFGLKWEWQKAVLKHNQVLRESYSPLPASVIVVGTKVIKELRYELRENATVIKINQVIELYRDKLKEVVKNIVFKPKKLSGDEVYQRFNQAWRSSPSWQQAYKDFESESDSFLNKSLQDYEDEKTTRGTGGEKAAENEPVVNGGGNPSPVDPLKTAAPNTNDPAQKDRVLKLGFLVMAASRRNTIQVDPAAIEAQMKKISIKTIDDVDISSMDDAMKAKALHAAQGFLGLHGGAGIIGQLDTELDPVAEEPEQEKGVGDLITMTNKEIYKYLVSAVGQTAVDAVMGEYGGKIPRGKKKEEFIHKVLAKKQAAPSQTEQYRQKLRNGVKPKLKLYLETVDPAEKVTYIKNLLRQG